MLSKWLAESYFGKLSHVRAGASDGCSRNKIYLPHSSPSQQESRRNKLLCKQVWGINNVIKQISLSQGIKTSTFRTLPSNNILGSCLFTVPFAFLSHLPPSHNSRDVSCFPPFSLPPPVPLPYSPGLPPPLFVPVSLSPSPTD